MRPLDVDFAPASPWRRRAVLALAVVVWTLAALQGARLWQHWQAARRHEVLAAQAQARASLAIASERARQLAADDPVQVQRRRDLQRLQSFPLGDVMRSVEQAHVAGARVTAIDADAMSGHAQVEFEADSLAVATKLMGALRADPAHFAWQLEEAAQMSTNTFKGRITLQLAGY